MRQIVLFLLAMAPLLAAGQATPFRAVFTNMTEFGGLFGQVKYGQNSSETVDKRVNLTAQTFNGVLLRPRLAVGGTVGVDWYNTAMLTPVCASLRYDLGSQKNLRVFGSFDTGWSFAWFNEDPVGYKTTGGWVVSPGVGFRIGKPTNANFILSLSYKRQQADVEKPLFFNELAKHETRVYNRVALRMGVSF